MKMTNTKCLGGLICALLFAWLGNGQASAEELSVAKGSSARISVESFRRIIVANPAIIDARPSDDGRSIVVSGLSEGQSELRIERLQGPDVIYRVSVRADLQELMTQIQDLLSDVEGLEIKVVGDKIVLKGNVLTKSGYEKVSQVVGAYSGVILNMAKLDRTAMNKYVEAAILKDIGSDNITVRINEDTAILEGVVYSDADMKRAIDMAKLRVPNVTSLLRVQEIMIETDVLFVQISKDADSSFGNNVLKNFSATGVGGFAGSTAAKPPVTYAVNGTATATINALVSNSKAKILERPHLSTKSGGEGHFQSGGEVYFSVAGNVGGSLEKVEFGVILKVKPTMQGRDRIVNDVTVEVSVPSAKPQGTFSLDKFETQSTAMCKVGESIVLSGLMETLKSRFKEKTPLLGDIPLLSLFFAEQGRQADNKELLVLITPTPVFPQASTSPSYSKDREQLLKDTDGSSLH